MNFLSFFLRHSQRWKSRETFNLASSHLKLFHIREIQMRKRTANRSISFVTQRCPSLSAFQRFLLYADWNGWLNEAKISSGFRVDRARCFYPLSVFLPWNGECYRETILLGGARACQRGWDCKKFWPASDVSFVQKGSTTEIVTRAVVTPWPYSRQT